MTIRARVLLAAAVVALTMVVAKADAAYPGRPITMVVPWAAGSGTDIVARIFSAGLHEEVGVPVNVVNRGGGSGVIGDTAIAVATPDGYTSGVGSPELTFLKTVGLGDRPRRHAGQSLGLPTDPVRGVPSEGGAPSLQDVMAGGITIFSGSPVEARSLIEAGKVRTLAVMTEKRSPILPDVPTLNETVGSDWAYANWFPHRAEGAVRQCGRDAREGRSWGPCSPRGAEGAPGLRRDTGLGRQPPGFRRVRQ